MLKTTYFFLALFTANLYSAAADDRPQKMALDVIVQLLIKHGAHIEAQTNAGFTPLGLAALGGYKSIVKLLLAHGAQIHPSLLKKLQSIIDHTPKDLHYEQMIDQTNDMIEFLKQKSK